MNTTFKNFLIFIFLEDISPFGRVIDTSVLNFWGCLPWVSKPGWIPRLHTSSPVWIPLIHLWSNTCWRFNSQHCSRACTCTCDKHWWDSNSGSSMQHSMWLNHSGSAYSFYNWLNVTISISQHLVLIRKKMNDMSVIFLSIEMLR